MKTFNKFIIVLLALGTFSCEEFLDEEYLAGASTEQYYTSPSGMESLVAAAYVTNKIWFGQEEGYDFSTAGTDIYDYGQQHPQQYQYTFTTDFNPTNSRLVVLWVELYRGVNTCNDAIDILSDPDRTPLDESMTKMRLSEVRFLRALYNWLIVETWGGVHLSTEPVKGVVLDANRTPVEEFYKLILEDLNFAVDNLSETNNTAATDFGRVTKMAALGFRSRMNLTWGYYSGDNSYLTDAANDAEAVIASGQFSLWDNYADLWSLENNDNNPENVWAINYSRTEFATMNIDPETYQNYQREGDKPWDDREGGHLGHLMFGMQYDVIPGLTRDVENGRPFRRYNPTMYLIDAFHEDVDERFYGSFKTTWFANDPDTTGLRWPRGPWHDDPADPLYGKPVLVPGDTAIFLYKGFYPDDATLIEDEVLQNYIWHYERNFWTLDHAHMFNPDGTIRGERTNDRNLCFELSKFSDPDRPAANGVGSERGIRDAYVVRYAEMFLNAAEAMWKTGAGGDAYNHLLTLANKRSYDGDGAAMLASYGINSGADLSLDFFLNERAREFCGEQIRWFDLKRTGTQIQRMKQYAGNPLARQNFSEKFNLRPIPQIQIDAIGDPSYQNPGY
ncbi:MAG: RagB/SusD family nutrient uptake outer membrane protein [Bacteroidales bacterium]